MDSIASKASVSKRTLYKHFPSKRALLDEILLYLIGLSQQNIKLEYDSNLNLKDQWVDVVTQKVSSMLEPQHIKLGKIILSELLKNESCIGHEEFEKVLRSESSVLVFIKHAQEDHKISKFHDKYHVVDMLQQLINGIIFFPVLFGKKSEASSQDIEFIASCLCSHFSVETSPN